MIYVFEVLDMHTAGEASQARPRLTFWLTVWTKLAPKLDSEFRKAREQTWKNRSATGNEQI